MRGSRARGRVRVRARGGARGSGLVPGRGTFSESRPPARASGGACPRPWTRAGVGKVAPRAWGGLGAARVSWFFSPAPSGPSAARPPARRFKPPARTPVPAAGRGPRAAPDGSATFCPGPESGRRAPLGRGTPSPCGRPPLPRRGAMGGSRAGWVRAAKFSRRGGGAASQTLRSCHRPLAAGGRPPARAGSPCGGRTREPLRAVPSRGPPPPRGCRGSPRGFAPCGRRGCCLPGSWVALPSGWSLSRRSLPAVAH